MGSYKPDNPHTADITEVDCLSCGTRRTMPASYTAATQCPECGYVGWCSPGELTAVERSRLLAAALRHKR